MKISLPLLITSLLGTLPALAELPKLQLQTSTTVSGVSSGGYMAAQYHLAHSTSVTGAGIIAAGPWYCAQNSLSKALSNCVDKTTGPIDLAPLHAQAKVWAKAGKLDPLDHLKASKVWLFHGTLDTKVANAVADALHLQYAQWIAPENLVYINDQAINHVMPTIDAGTACEKSEPPFVGKCNYDAAGQLLSHLLGQLSAPIDSVAGKLHSFDQQALGGESAASLADEGFVYIPNACASGASCRLHISFHGCQQNAQAIGDTYAREAGFNRWADANNLVVLYPQTKKSLFSPMNPKACWDWWGYTDDDYATRDGAQIKAVHTMALRLSK